MVTGEGTAPARIVAGKVRASASDDIAKVAVVERHHATGRRGVGFVRGFGLRRGAFASTVAHDAHNIVVAGMNDSDMLICVNRLIGMGGGLVVAAGGTIVNELPLEVAGLMSVRGAHQVSTAISAMERTLQGLGVVLDTPFMYLGFLALSVIPQLRITDHGLVDVSSFRIVPLIVP